MKKLCKAIFKVDIVSILLVVLLNSNVFRFFGCPDKAMYGIYIVTFFVLCRKFSSSFNMLVNRYKVLKTFNLLTLLLVVYAFFTSLIYISLDNIYLSCKLLLTFLIISYIPALSKQTVFRVIVLSIIANFVYCIYALLNPSRYVNFLEGNSTYLNFTLTIGLSLTISLVLFIYSFVRRSLFLIILSGFGVFFFLLCLLQFPARGALLFPPLVAFFIMPFMAKKAKIKGLLIIALFAFAFMYASDYFFNSGSTYAVKHMTDLFENTEDESRIVIWEKCTNVMLSNGWFVLGGGVGAFMRETGAYPHNLFLQMLGEFGFLGFIWIIYFMLISFRCVKKIVKQIDDENKGLSFCILGSFMYYLLNFMKSFQLYEMLPLLIFFMFCVVLSDKYCLREQYDSNV